MGTYDKRSNDLDKNVKPQIGLNKSHGSVEPIGKMMEARAQIAIMLPVVIRDTGEVENGVCDGRGTGGALAGESQGEWCKDTFLPRCKLFPRF